MNLHIGVTPLDILVDFARCSNEPSSDDGLKQILANLVVKSSSLTGFLLFALHKAMTN